MRARAEICQCLPELSWGVVWGPRQGHGGMLRVAHCLCPPPPPLCPWQLWGWGGRRCLPSGAGTHQ